MTAQLPEAAAAYVWSVNGSDPAGFIALFADGAVVDDAGRHFRGREAIRAWAARDIFAAHVTLDVLDVSGNDDDFVITTRVDGTFDRAGLPDPVIITHRMSVGSGKIVGLTCRLAGEGPNG